MITEIKTMREAYEMMCTIENTIRTEIKEKMKATYGAKWLISAPSLEKYPPFPCQFEALHFYDLISFFSKYDCLRSSHIAAYIEELHKLIKVRNTISHHRMLNRNQYVFLEKMYEAICEKRYVASVQE